MPCCERNFEPPADGFRRIEAEVKCRLVGRVMPMSAGQGVGCSGACRPVDRLCVRGKVMTMANSIVSTAPDIMGGTAEQCPS
jgi:hypothetical protein